VIISLTLKEYQKLSDGYMGICLACCTTQERVEPDAQGYTCHACGKKRVCGVEHALIAGVLDIGPKPIKKARTPNDESLEAYWATIRPKTRRSRKNEEINSNRD
jgi:hypothetical protein